MNKCYTCLKKTNKGRYLERGNGGKNEDEIVKCFICSECLGDSQ